LFEITKRSPNNGSFFRVLAFLFWLEHPNERAVAAAAAAAVLLVAAIELLY